MGQGVQFQVLVSFWSSTHQRIFQHGEHSQHSGRPGEISAFEIFFGGHVNLGNDRILRGFVLSVYLCLPRHPGLKDVRFDPLAEQLNI